MVPADCASAMYFASTEGVERLSIQYAVGVPAMASNSGLPAPAAAARAFDDGLTKKGIPASGFPSLARRTAEAGASSTATTEEPMPATAATARNGEFQRATAPATEDVTPET